MNHIGFKNRGFKESLSRFSSLDYMQRYVDVNIKVANNKFKNMIINSAKKSLKKWGMGIATIAIIAPLSAPALNGYVKPLVYDKNDYISKNINVSIEKLNKKVPNILKNVPYYIDYNKTFDKFSTIFYDNLEYSIGITSPKRNMEYKEFDKKLNNKTIDVGLKMVKNINDNMQKSALNNDGNYKDLYLKYQKLIHHIDRISEKMDEENRNKVLNNPFFKTSNVLGS